ncbi:MerR family transcriptional regulator [Ruegeria sp.]|uniref:MerR family transcriptional regulator n=1 Tax=Ruegeria sp. TaxID=1879320 RepID=UPI003C7C40AC
MSKSPDAFRTISEVADWLGVQAHVLRFWESRFSQVKPVKRAGGRRYYRPNDMRLLGGIKKLLHDDGITIKGVQRILREQGVAHVAALSPDLDDDAQQAAPVVDGTVAQADTVDGTVVPLDTKPDPHKDRQFGLDLQSPPPVANGADVSAPKAPVALTEPAGVDDLDTAPLMGGIASLTWQVSDFDPQVLRRIAPIVKDLRAWLDRVETQPAG